MPQTLNIILIPLAVSALILFLFLDFRRRRLDSRQFQRLPWLGRLDLLAPGLAAASAVYFCGRLYPGAAMTGTLSLHSPALLALVLSVVMVPVFWSEGRKQIQFQRPLGLLFAEWLCFAAAVTVLPALYHWHGIFRASTLLPAVLLFSGALLMARVVPPFLRKYEGLRILESVSSQEQFSQPEYTPATPECPQPQLWHMLDSQTTELEVLDFLKTLVITLKPKVIVETGTFLGYGTLKLAEGARQNGFGKVITIEADPDIRQRAVLRFQAAGLSDWIESRLESSLDTVIDGSIDLLFSDSHLANREAEIRRLLPQLDPRGVLVIHDASSHFKVVREAALRLEAEGLISTVLLSTPRGVAIAQRRAGRR